MRVASFTLVLSFYLFGNARADFIVYRLPKSKLKIYLEGTVLPGGPNTVLFRHNLGTLTFMKSDIDKPIKVPEIRPTLRNQAIRAHKAGDTDACFAAGIELLRRGHIKDFLTICTRIQETKPEHAGSKSVLALQKQLEAEIPEAQAELDELREIVSLPGMKVARGRHFILLHDVEDADKKPSEKGTVERRLELLEQVYQTFYYYFAARGVRLEVPKERMRQVLYADQKDFLARAEAYHPQLKSSSGFYYKLANIAYFFEHASAEELKELHEIGGNIPEMKKDLMRLRRKYYVGQARQMLDLFSVLIKALEENANICVVSHETTHQLAANSGLLALHCMIPEWAHEGLATYFECPKDAVWSGIGAVNEERLTWYRALEKDKSRSNIEHIVSNRIFQTAKKFEDQLHAYGQAWALTHFLMNEHFAELTAYYQLLASTSIADTPDPELFLKLFRQAMKKPTTELELEWRKYMNGLKTDFERAKALARN